MPAFQADNWRELLSWLDTYLARPRRRSSSEMSKARAVLETQLDLDSRTYGDIPPDIVGTALERMDRLSASAAGYERKTRSSKALTVLTWPVSPVQVTSHFGRRLHPITKVYHHHQGIDLAAEPSQAVRAVAGGIVSRAEFNFGYGNHIEVDHGGGMMTRYGHLSAMLVVPGHLVQQGDAIGLAGSTGVTTGVHLHFELWRRGEAVDPLEELGQPPTGRVPMAVSPGPPGPREPGTTLVDASITGGTPRSHR